MFCRKCGQPHYVEDNYCTKCGSRIKTELTNVSSGDPIKKQLPDQPKKHTKFVDIALYGSNYYEHFIKVGLSLKNYLEEIEISIIRKALGKVNGIKNKAAADLCLNRTTLVEKIKKYNIKM